MILLCDTTQLQQYPQEQRISSKQSEIQYKIQFLCSSKETKKGIVFQADNPGLSKSNNGAMNKWDVTKIKF